MTVSHHKDMHPKVLPWFDQHKHEQDAVAQKIANNDDVIIRSLHEPIIDLTERDLYRFSVTSDLLYALEAIGATIESADITGKIQVWVQGESLPITVTEKMRQGIGPHSASKQIWTAFPKHHSPVSVPSGFLRFRFDRHTLTYDPREWVETKVRRPKDIIPQIVEFLPAVAHAIIAQTQIDAKERLEQTKIDAKAQKIENENRRVTERWGEYRRLAVDWQEVQRLETFLCALREKSKAGEYSLDGLPLHEWIELAEKQIAALDPLDRLVAL